MKTLKEYAEKHGTTEQAFIDAGYKEVIKDGLKALSFPTNGGIRYRFLEGTSKYKGFGNEQVWYRLDEAIALTAINKADMPLIITNGEASVVAAQSKGFPATAITMGEKASIPEHLLAELKTKYPNDSIYLAYDSDKTGVNATKGVYEQLKANGFHVLPLNFDKDNGYDLADWLVDNPNAKNIDFGRIKFYDFNPITDIAVIDAKEVAAEETAQIIEKISENFPWIEYVEEHFGSVEHTGKGEYKVVGQSYGGFFFNPDKGLWQFFSDDKKRGNVVHLVMLATFGDKFDMYNKAQFAESIREAAAIAKVDLPERKSKVVEGEVIPTFQKENGRLQSAQYIQVLNALGYTFRMNDLLDTIEVNGKPITDVIKSIINMKMADLGLYYKYEIEDAYIANAYENRYNPLKDYLNSLVWDGNDHLSKFISHLHENGDEPVAQIFVKRWFIGAVAKILDRKQNVMLVLVGAQNGGKSTLARWMCPLQDYFIEKRMEPENKDDHLRLASTMVWEVGELGATTRKADTEGLKQMITREMIQERKSYGKYDIIKPATASLIGTVNHDGAGFLFDTTGNRRFMSVPIESIDFSYTEMDIHQIWAQAVALYHSGEPYRLTPEELELQARINTNYEAIDPLEDVINRFYVADKKGFVLGSDILEVVKENGSFGANDTAIAMKIAKTLTKLGYKPHRTAKERGWIGLKPITSTFKSRLK